MLMYIYVDFKYIVCCFILFLDYCPEGQERMDNGNCVDCEIGFYKHNTNDRFMNCTACPSDYVTPGKKSTSSQQCTVSKYQC